jgi:hypothetical protein
VMRRRFAGAGLMTVRRAPSESGGNDSLKPARVRQPSGN